MVLAIIKFYYNTIVILTFCPGLFFSSLITFTSFSTLFFVILIIGVNLSHSQVCNILSFMIVFLFIGGISSSCFLSIDIYLELILLIVLDYQQTIS